MRGGVSESEIQVKLLFLASLRTHFGDRAEFRQLVGDRAIKCGNVLMNDGQFRSSPMRSKWRNAESGLSPDVVRSIERTGAPVVDAWIAQIQRGN